MLDDAVKTLKLAQSLEDRTPEQRRRLMSALVQEGRAKIRPTNTVASLLFNLEMDGITVESNDTDQLIEIWRITALAVCS